MQRSAHPNARHRRKAAHEQENDNVRFLRDLSKSLLCSLSIALVLLFISSLGIYFLEDPVRLIPLSGISISALTAFFGGVFAIRIHRRSALVCGFCNGAALSALMLLLSPLLRAEASGYSALLSCLLHAGFLLLSVAGAFAGRPRQSRKVKRRKRS